MKMKNLLLTAVFILTVVFAQSQEIRFAAKAGTNFGTVTWELQDLTDGEFDVWQYETGVGFYVGGRVEYGLNQRMSIQGEIFYQVTRATDYSWSDDDFTDEYTFIYHDLSIPLVYKFYVIPQKLSINAGVSLGILLSAEEENYMVDIATGESETDYWDLKNGDPEIPEDDGILNPLNVGVSMGVEYKITDNLFVDFRYNMGLSNLGDTEDWDIDSNIKVGVLQVGLGWRF